MIKHCVFYLYCYFLMMMIYSKIKDHNFLNITYKALGITLIIQTLLWPFLKSQGVRTQMFFNNPNQLALWGICLLVIVYIVSRLLDKKNAYTVVLLLLCSFFIIISASRAALGGAIVFWLFFISKSTKQLIVLSIISIVALTFINFSFDIDLTKVEAIEYNMERFSSHSVTSDQSFGGRGYQRIKDYPNYLLFGAGEGAYDRFNEEIELHSNLPNVLFCYGIIGLFIYLSAFFIFVKNITREIFALLFIIAFFGSVHMTMRIPLFWIALLFLIYLHDEKIQAKNLINTD